MPPPFVVLLPYNALSTSHAVEGALFVCLALSLSLSPCPTLSVSLSLSRCLCLDRVAMPIV